MSWVTTTIPYLVVLCAASACWQFSRTSRQRLRFRPVATLTAVVLIGVSCTLQLTVAPFLLGDWQRNGFSAWLHQPYRLVTALLVQDGWLGGAIWNLAALLWIGLLAEAVWGWRRWILIALVSGIGAQVWGWLVQPVGAGASVLVFGLAGSLLVRGACSGISVARASGLLGLLCVIALLVSGDIHGGAAVLGALTALALDGQRRRRTLPER